MSNPKVTKAVVRKGGAMQKVSRPRCKAKGCKRLLKFYDKDFCTKCFMDAVKAVTRIKVEVMEVGKVYTIA